MSLTNPSDAQKALGHHNFNQALAALGRDTMSTGSDDRKPAGFGCGMGCGVVVGALLAAAVALWLLWRADMIEFYWPQWATPSSAPPPTKGGK
jgi:hypothetical protein